MQTNCFHECRQEVLFRNSICTKSSLSHSYITVITQNGYSALMLATREGRTEVVSLLREVGANTDLQNKVKLCTRRCGCGTLYVPSHCCLTTLVCAITQWNGYSALMLAAREGRTEVVSLLLEAGANTELQNMVKLCTRRCGFGTLYVPSNRCLTTFVCVITQKGYSALMLAVRWGRTEVVSLLLEAGANTELQNMVKCRCDLGILYQSVGRCSIYVRRDSGSEISRDHVQNAQTQRERLAKLSQRSQNH